MGVLELIQQKAFLGKEFLTWLWFRAERDGQVEIPKRKPVNIEVLGPILLDAQYGDARQSVLKGESPATSPEAHTALLEGKKLRRARFKWSREDAEWTFTLDGESFAVSGLSVPNAGRLPFEDSMTMRLSWIREFEEALGELFEVFLGLRLDEKEWIPEVRAIQGWVESK
jgi:hypothetical protein